MLESEPHTSNVFCRPPHILRVWQAAVSWSVFGSKRGNTRVRCACSQSPEPNDNKTTAGRKRINELKTSRIYNYSDNLINLHWHYSEACTSRTPAWVLCSTFTSMAQWPCRYIGTAIVRLPAQCPPVVCVHGCRFCFCLAGGARGLNSVLCPDALHRVPVTDRWKQAETCRFLQSC